MGIFTLDLFTVNNKLSSVDPVERVRWALETFGDKFSISSSFGSRSAVLLHIISKVSNHIPILFIDTGYHFSETIAYREYLQKILDLNIITIRPELIRMEFEQLNNYSNENNQTFCCHHNKVLPLQKALKEYDCWGTGIRRDQTTDRCDTQFLIREKRDHGRYKLAPIADYSEDDCKLYFQINDLPEHPLIRKGYRSIGCDCCTGMPKNDDDRSGRWNGTKTECGLHTMNGDGDGI